MERRTLARVLGLLVLLGVVAPFAVYAVPDLVGAEHSFVVLSGSMAPAISPGDAVVVDADDPATIQEGDVITFVRSESESPTTHRVVDVTRQDGRLAFETKGDANEDPDAGLVPAANVVGTVAVTIPVIGHVVQFANTPVGFVLFLGLPLGALAVTEVWSLAKRYRAATESAPETAQTGPGQDEESPDRTDDASPADEDEKEGDDIAAVTAERSNEAPDERADAGNDDAAATAPENAPADAESVAQDERGTETDDGDETETVTVHPSDLTATTALLAVTAPYAVYVAVQLRSALAFAVAFASGFLLLAAGGLWVTERLAVDSAAETGTEQNVDTERVDGVEDASPDAATDGGAVEEGE
jgi:signal peptidase